MSLLHSEHGSNSGKSISLTALSSRLLRILYPRFLYLTREGLSDEGVLFFSLGVLSGSEIGSLFCSESVIPIPFLSGQ